MDRKTKPCLVIMLNPPFTGRAQGNAEPKRHHARDAEFTYAAKKTKAPTSWGSVVWISLPAPGGTNCVGATLLSIPGRTSYYAVDMFTHSNVPMQHLEQAPSAQHGACNAIDRNFCRLRTPHS